MTMHAGSGANDATVSYPLILDPVCSASHHSAEKLAAHASKSRTGYDFGSEAIEGSKQRAAR